MTSDHTKVSETIVLRLLVDVPYLGEASGEFFITIDEGTVDGAYSAFISGATNTSCLGPPGGPCLISVISDGFWDITDASGEITGLFGAGGAFSASVSGPLGSEEGSLMLTGQLAESLDDALALSGLDTSYNPSDSRASAEFSASGRHLPTHLRKISPISSSRCAQSLITPHSSIPPFLISGKGRLCRFLTQRWDPTRR